MNTRQTDVAWDPTIVRVEYVDERGTPYYCTFQPRPRSTGSQTAGPSSRRDVAPASGWDEELAELLTELLAAAFLKVLAGALLQSQGNRLLTRWEGGERRANGHRGSDAAPPPS